MQTEQRTTHRGADLITCTTTMAPSNELLSKTSKLSSTNNGNTNLPACVSTSTKLEPLIPNLQRSSSSTMSNGSLTDRCVELALEGERRCRHNDPQAGVTYLEAALTVGTDDLQTLSAIYSQLGNAYFYLGDYLKALEYHRHDVTLARTIGDKQGEAKASGNLGNTLKVLGKHDEAILCCQRHLDLSREMNDRVGESRALYNLGNVYHAKGKHIGRVSNYEAGEYPQDVRDCLLKAVNYYEQNMQIVQELNNKAAEGRSCGNLGNTYYLLGDFSKAVHYHLKRLDLAKQFGDKPAMRRAYSNLGNAQVFLGQFEEAIKCYKQALAISIELTDSATEAQACYSLGNTATLLGEHEQAIEYHTKHLIIARQLSDRVGQARTAWSLGNAFLSLNQHSKALYFVMLHLQLSSEIGDLNGESIAEQNLQRLHNILGHDATPDNSGDPSPVIIDKNLGQREFDMLNVTASSIKQRSFESGSDTNSLGVSFRGDRKQSSFLSVNQVQPLFGSLTDDLMDDETFFEFLSKAQSKRMDDQRCDAKALLDNKENKLRLRDTVFPPALSPSIQHSVSMWSLSSLRRSTVKHYQNKLAKYKRMKFGKQRPQSTVTIVENEEPKTTTAFNGNIEKLYDDEHQRACCSSFVANNINDGLLKRTTRSKTLPIIDGNRTNPNPDEFMDFVVGIQSRRMNDQRANLPELPGLQHPDQVLGPHLQLDGKPIDKSDATSVDSAVETSTATTRSDETTSSNQKRLDDEFIEMLIRCQSTRIDEQRSELPEARRGITVPDDDFFQMILKMQARRFDEQRANLTPNDDQSSDVQDN